MLNAFLSLQEKKQCLITLCEEGNCPQFVNELRIEMYWKGKITQIIITCDNACLIGF